MHSHTETNYTNTNTHIILENKITLNFELWFFLTPLGLSCDIKQPKAAMLVFWRPAETSDWNH